MDLQNVAFIDVDLIQVRKRANLLHEFKVIFERIQVTRTKVWNRMKAQPSTVACVIGVEKCDLTWFRLHPRDWVHFRKPRKVHSLVRLGPFFWKVLRKIEEHY